MEHREELSVRIGEAVKYHRQEMAWTIKQLADASGLSSSFVSRLERGQTMPSIPSLQTLADALKVDLETFFTKEEDRRYVISRKDSRRHHHSLRGPKRKTVYEMELFADGMDNPLMEPALVTIRTRSDEVELVTHGGQEFMYVVEGRIRMSLGSRTFELEEGDAAYWDGGLPHGATSLGPGPAKTLNVHLVPGRRTDTFQITKELTGPKQN